MKITGKNGYYGTITLTFQIVSANNSNSNNNSNATNKPQATVKTFSDAYNVYTVNNPVPLLL